MQETFLAHHCPSHPPRSAATAEQTTGMKCKGIFSFLAILSTLTAAASSVCPTDVGLLPPAQHSDQKQIPRSQRREAQAAISPRTGT